MDSLDDQFVTIARVVKPQGRRGEVIAEPHTNVREQFTVSSKMQAICTGGIRRELQLEEHWFHKQRIVFKFRGVDTIDQAEQLRGCELQIARRELIELKSGSYYVGELTGCSVFDRGTEVGEVVGVQFGAGEAPLLVVRGKNGDELLVPFAEQYVVRTDVRRKVIEMSLPERLLELNAPLSAEEKQAQRRSG